MKKFRFKLEVVLSERKRLEDQKLKDWTLARRILQTMVDDLTRLEKGLDDAIGKSTQLAGSREVSSVGMFSAVDQFIKGQKVRIMWKAGEIERGSKIVERTRLEYIKARQKREALEKLRERKLAEHRAAAAKDELKKLDDIYIMNGAARKRMDDEAAAELARSEGGSSSMGDVG